MPCIDISRMIRYNTVTGMLEVLDGCCDWQPVIGWTPALDVNAPIGEDPLNPDPDGTPPTYYACGKALAAVAKIRAVAQTAYTEYTSDPIGWIVAFRTAHPDLAGGDMHFIAACNHLVTLDAVFSEDDLFAQDYFSYITRVLFIGGTATPEPITENAFNAIKSRTTDYFFRKALDTGDEAYLLLGVFYVAVIDAIGSGDMGTISQLGARTNGDCTYISPFAPLFTQQRLPGDAWNYEFDFRQSTLHPAVQLSGENFHEPGLGVWANLGSTQNNNNVEVAINFDQLDNGSTLQRIGLAFITRGGEDYNDGQAGISVPGKTLYTYAAFAAWTDEPANAGTWNLPLVAAEPLGPTENLISFSLHNYHPGAQLDDVSANSLILVGVFIAGTGPGPIASPPP